MKGDGQPALTWADEEKPERLLTFREHLGELKQRLKISAIAFFASLAFWLLAPVEAFDPSALVTGLYRPAVSIVLDNAESLAAGRVTIIAGTLTAPLEIYFLAGLVMALITSAPVIGYEVYRFVDPALLPNERRPAYRFSLAFTGLFLAGAGIGYFVLLPAIIRFLAYFAMIVGAQPVITASDYYSMVFTAVGATGIAFTSPAIFLLLINFGVISTSALTKNRLIVYLGLYILIAAITPEPVVGHFGMFFPIVLMLELSVLIGKRIERNRAAQSGGGAAPPKPRCPYCNAERRAGTPFCHVCGRALA